MSLFSCVVFLTVGCRVGNNNGRVSSSLIYHHSSSSATNHYMNSTIITTKATKQQQKKINFTTTATQEEWKVTILLFSLLNTEEEKEHKRKKIRRRERSSVKFLPLPSCLLFYNSTTTQPFIYTTSSLLSHYPNITKPIPLKKNFGGFSLFVTHKQKAERWWCANSYIHKKTWSI